MLDDRGKSAWVHAGFSISTAVRLLEDHIVTLKTAVTMLGDPARKAAQMFVLKRDIDHRTHREQQRDMRIGTLPLHVASNHPFSGSA